MNALAHLKSRGNHALDLLSKTANFDVGYFMRGGMWLGLAYAVNALIRLSVIIVVAQAMDKTVFGQYQFILTVFMALMVFTLPGMGTAITQSVANGFNSSLISGTRSKMKWGMLGSVALVGIAAFFAWRQETIWSIFLVIALFFPFYAVYTAVLAFYRGKEDFRSSALYGFVFTLVNAIAVLGAFFLFGTLMSVFVSMMLFAGLASLIIYYIASRKVARDPVDEQVVVYGRHLTLMMALNNAAPYADKILVAALAGFEGVAVYAVATVLTLNLALLGKLLTSLLLPKLSRAQAHHVKRIKAVFWWLTLVVAVSVVAGIVVIPWIIPILFSEKYIAAIPYAQVALLYLVFIFPASVLDAFFQARKKTKLLYAYNLGTGIANLVLLAVLVPLFGLWGAVSSKVALGLIQFVFLTGAFYRQKP